ncbi:hypothetical protein ACFX4N_24560 [Priestia sp. YIM B13551]|uniref:hypothetical protein n=1 Tax=Priestia sp. YIM B13551 TaxID=3366306 RepID=UPI0036730517
MYKVTIETLGFNPIKIKTETVRYTGEFEGSLGEAIESAKDFYSSELGTDIEEIKIVDIQKI